MIAIAVIDDWQGVARGAADWSSLEARAAVTFISRAFESEDDAAAALAPFEILLTMRERTALPASLIARLPRLRMIGITGRAHRLLDLDSCTARGIVVSATEGATAPHATAELALGLLLAAARRVPEADAGIRAGRFQEGLPVGVSLAGKTLGLVGLGRLGARMARYGRALDMRVIAWSPNLTDERAAAAGCERADKDALFAEADAVSLHLVLAAATRGIVDAATIARMKRGAILVNTSRAGLVDEAALRAAAASGRIVAALDVFGTEPLPGGDPWRGTPNTVLTPHLGYGVAETWADFYPQSVENARAFLDGRPVRVVNAKVLAQGAG